MSQLTEISRKNLQSLRDLYTPDGKKYYTTYTAINNYCEWFKQNPDLKNIHFYCLNGDFSKGTFVVTVSIFLDMKRFE